MKYENLTSEQKIAYKNYCIKKFGETDTFSETGEPLYFNNKFELINNQILLDLLFVQEETNAIEKTPAEDKAIELPNKFGSLASDVAQEVLNAIKYEDNIMYFEIIFWEEVLIYLE